jgi:hypothetical protein
MKSSEFLQSAIDVQAERGKQYDKPTGERSMGATVTAFNAITGRDLSEAEGWLLLQTLKDVRQWQNPSKYHHDSALDGVAYSALKAEALSEEQVVEPSHIISDIPDMDEWQNWKKGGIIESLERTVGINYGESYILLEDPDENGDIHFIDSDGDGRARDADKYRFVSRPTSTAQ